jgi:hypothetical protein
MRRIYLHGLMALLLVFAQQAALVHLIAHATQHTSQHDPAPDGSKSCAKCLAAAHLGSAVGVAIPTLVIPASVPDMTATAPVAARTLVLHVYQSRAPPTVL